MSHDSCMTHLYLPLQCQEHPHGLLYAELGAPPPYSKRPTKPPSTKSTTQYVDVLPHSIPTDNTGSGELGLGLVCVRISMYVIAESISVL